MKKILLLTVIGWMISAFPALGQEIYRWVDEKGTIHFVEDLTLVPEKYRNQAVKKRLSSEPPDPSPSTPSSPTTTPSEPREARKDRFGRGEDWWRARVKEWEEKLQKAQSDYEKAYHAQKTKEKELEDSTFQPKSLKRRLQAELDELVKKTKFCEAEVIETRNMLEKVLPRQAEEDRADPKWLKLEKPLDPGQQAPPSPEPGSPGGISPSRSPTSRWMKTIPLARSIGSGWAWSPPCSQGPPTTAVRRSVRRGTRQCPFF
jgi:hypothetical protein